MGGMQLLFLRRRIARLLFVVAAAALGGSVSAGFNRYVVGEPDSLGNIERLGESARPSALDAPGESGGVLGGIIINVGWDVEADLAYLADAPSGEVVNNPAPGETVFFHCDWYVSGSGLAQQYFIRILLDDVPYCTGSAITEEGSYTLSCNDGWRAVSGHHTVRCELDYTDVLFEPDENNNVAERTWGSALDLVAVRGFMRIERNNGPEIDAPRTGQSVYFHLDARLDGAISPVTSHLQAWLDGSSYCAGDLTVRPGSSVFNCPSPWTVTPGEHTLTWQFDLDDRVGEVDELNNVVAKRWNAGAETPTPTVAIDTPTHTPRPYTPTPTAVPATATATGSPATPTPLVDPVEPTYGPRRAPPEVGDCDHDRQVAIGRPPRGLTIATHRFFTTSSLLDSSDRA